MHREEGMEIHTQRTRGFLKERGENGKVLKSSKTFPGKVWGGGGRRWSNHTGGDMEGLECRRPYTPAPATTPSPPPPSTEASSSPSPPLMSNEAAEMSTIQVSFGGFSSKHWYTISVAYTHTWRRRRGGQMETDTFSPSG